MPRARRIRGGLASPVIAALIAAMPDPGTEWNWADRQRWLSALQAALNLAYTAGDLPGSGIVGALAAPPGGQSLS